jgi:hypothetical protein
VECINPPDVDRYLLITTEFVGGGIIRVEFKQGEIGQKSVYAQSRKVELLIVFGGG